MRCLGFLFSSDHFDRIEFLYILLSASNSARKNCLHKWTIALQDANALSLPHIDAAFIQDVLDLMGMLIPRNVKRVVC